MKAKRDCEKKLKDFLKEGYEFEYECGTNNFYRKDKIVLVWCNLHDRFVQKMKDIGGGRFKVL